MFRGFLRRYGWRYIPGAVLLMLNSYLQTLMPIALGNAFDLLAEETVIRDAVLHQAAIILALAGSAFAVRFGWRMLIMGNARILEQVLREQLYVKLQNMPLSWYHRQRTGDLMAYAVNDINAVRMTFGPAFALTLTGLSTVSFSLFSMGTRVDALLTVLCMIPIVFAMAAIVWIGSMIRERFRRVQEQFAAISGRVNENISGMRVLKAFVQEAHHEKSFEAESGKMRDFNMRLNLVSASLNPLIEFFFGISFLVSVIRGGNLVLTGQMTVGSLVAFNAYLAMIMSPITSIGRIVNLIQRGVASYQRLSDILTAPEIPACEYETGLPLKGNIRIRDLTFRYQGTE
ncbi:MAG TPA: ABC transporter transmembrane domain-containing protein, partial [Clostridia bacterium]|nr:ABC transporter transmembrane domain-containing protein [Clostridia bacterium]